MRIVNQRALGSGGNADVYVGQRADNGDFVVVKYLREFQMSHARRAFAREVRILGRKLRGIVPLLFADTGADRPFYVMPYLHGGTLRRCVGRLSETQLHAVAADLAQTLANLHVARDVHGDVKPDNILVTADGRLQVADPLGNGTLFTMLFSENRGGTPGYWAPEIRNGGQISSAGDVYSYGATLYELVTGCRPQDGQHLDPVLVGCTRAPRIRELIVTCCQSNASLRPTMQEVSRILAGESWSVIQVERQRETALKAVCAVGLLVLGVAFVVKRPSAAQIRWI